MSDASASAVLHITAAAGGGADRYIRDLAATTTRRHFVLHAGPAVEVLEDIASARLLPLRDISKDPAGEWLARWSTASGVGLVHLHGMDQCCRGQLGALLRARPFPYVVTLHDLLFLNPQAFELEGMPPVDEAWIAELGQTLKRASMVIAPSPFIRAVATQHLPGIEATVISPGISTQPPAPALSTPADFASQAPRHVVAVVGAVGPHKGSALLEGIAAALEQLDVTLVVIGYTDTTLARGWIVPGRLYVHGPYENSAVTGWLAAYGAEAVLFPNRLPESFSYTLSEVWAAGLPAIVPEDGALGERVARHGGGWRLRSGFSAAEAAALLDRLFSAEGAEERARVKSAISPLDPVRVPTLEAMSRDVDALYARFALPSTAVHHDAARDALVPLLAANLDGFVFRKELLSLAGQLEQAMADATESKRWSEQLERDSAAWAAKLEADIAALRRDYTAEIQRLVDENRRLAEQNAQLATDHRRFASQNARLDADNRRLGKQNVRLDDEIQRLRQLGPQVEQLKAALAEARQRVIQQERDWNERAAKYRDELASLRRGHAADISRFTEGIRHLDEETRKLVEQDSRHAGENRQLAADNRHLADENRQLAQEGRQAADENRQLSEENQQRTAENRRLRDEIGQLATYKAAFELGPEVAQKYLLRKLSRARR